MTLTDAGPLLAILDIRDQHHTRCTEAAAALEPGPMLTTWPCFTEAMYLLHRAGGFRFQAALWELYADGHVIVHDLSPKEIARMSALMAQYRDTPMDLADASLVAVAESGSHRRVFTLDRHFWTYRLADGSALEPIPARP